MKVIFKNGGKQYKAQVGDIILLDNLGLEPKSTLVINDVLAIVDGESTIVGNPYVNNAKVEVEIVHNGRDKKVITFKKRRRKDSKKKRGFRRDFSKVRILSISKGD